MFDFELYSITVTICNSFDGIHCSGWAVTHSLVFTVMKWSALKHPAFRGVILPRFKNNFSSLSFHSLYLVSSVTEAVRTSPSDLRWAVEKGGGALSRHTIPVSSWQVANRLHKTQWKLSASWNTKVIFQIVFPIICDSFRRPKIFAYTFSATKSSWPTSLPSFLDIPVRNQEQICFATQRSSVSLTLSHGRFTRTQLICSRFHVSTRMLEQF